VLTVIGLTTKAQQSEESLVQSKIIKFFDAFHKQDTIALKTMVNGDITMQSIGTNPEGKTMLQDDSFSSFLKRIASIPKDKSFEEKILDFNIQTDGAMANAWTPYEFWYDGKFSHCGVNSFQFMKVDEQWKIIYLVDTRRRDGCQPNSKN